MIDTKSRNNPPVKDHSDPFNISIILPRANLTESAELVLDENELPSGHNLQKGESSKDKNTFELISLAVDKFMSDHPEEGQFYLEKVLEGDFSPLTATNFIKTKPKLNALNSRSQEYSLRGGAQRIDRRRSERLHANLRPVNIQLSPIRRRVSQGSQHPDRFNYFHLPSPLHSPGMLRRSQHFAEKSAERSKPKLIQLTSSPLMGQGMELLQPKRTPRTLKPIDPIVKKGHCKIAFQRQKLRKLIENLATNTSLDSERSDCESEVGDCVAIL
eukprot:CAMPEP_0114987850 /NCGR_PEP_ID=MMETSP0216-20121206/9255_1 /TAXON_ID=223996 /ORGANISM="Protocruzia adherens, Strain Boccale" /LENGTH=271 /DNA_ID=CAMNT_0002350531 /DNA_START=185 /DNA_END=1000 /DNA_ORIENTATION=-